MKTDLHSLFIDQLRDILWAERKLVDALPKMAAQASSTKLAEAFQSHAKESEGHVDRVVELLASVNQSGRGKKCAAMEGLLKEGRELIDEYAGTPAGDAALIAAAQKVEHYEIATYGTLRAFAATLGHQQAIEIIGQILDEEKAADEKLSTLAENTANPEATEGDDSI